MANDAVSSSARGAGFLILLQIASRAVTFALNQILLRFLSPALLGASVQLELFVISAHHFARESLRVACQRQPEGGIQAAINLSYGSIAAGVPIVLILGEAYLRTSFPDVLYFVEALRVYQLAAIVELISEPAFVAVQQKMLYKTRAAAEATAVVIKTLATAITVFWGRYKGIELGLLPFAAGEIAYASALTLVFMWHTLPVATKQHFSLLPIEIKTSDTDTLYLSRFSSKLVRLSASLYVQQGIKYLLTEGDVLVSSTFASLEDQGMYALSANYGGLIARMLFRPIEDACRNLFSQLCAPIKTPSSTPTLSTEKKKKQLPTPREPILQASQTFALIIRSYTLLFLPLLTIGPRLAPLLLTLIAGPKWSQTRAGTVLSTYIYSLPLLALNGVSEAFVAASATTSQLNTQSLYMALFSAAFAGSAYVFLQVMGLGAEGLVWANCVNMGLRCLFNFGFVRRFFEREGVILKVGDLVPNFYAVAAAVVVPGILGSTEGVLGEYGLLGELGRIAAIGAVLVMFVAFTEREFLLDCYRRFRS